MSGIDEQNLDIESCSCGEFSYWIIEGLDMCLGYLNSDAWIGSASIRSVNKTYSSKHLTEDEFINKITSFVCKECGQVIKKGHDLFKRLYSDVSRRWDIKGPKNSDDVM